MESFFFKHFFTVTLYIRNIFCQKQKILLSVYMFRKDLYDDI